MASAGASDVVNVIAETNDPEKSARIATTYVRAFIALRKRSDRDTITDAAKLLDVRSRRSRTTTRATRRRPTSSRTAGTS